MFKLRLVDRIRKTRKFSRENVTKLDLRSTLTVTYCETPDKENVALTQGRKKKRHIFLINLPQYYTLQVGDWWCLSQVRDSQNLHSGAGSKPVLYSMRAHVRRRHEWEGLWRPLYRCSREKNECTLRLTVNAINISIVALNASAFPFS